MQPGGDAGLLPALLDAYQAQPHAVRVEVIFNVGNLAVERHFPVFDKLAPPGCTMIVLKRGMFSTVC